MSQSWKFSRPSAVRWRRARPIGAALIGGGARDAAADTEVLGHVEGFETDFHRRTATVAQSGPALFELPDRRRGRRPRAVALVTASRA